jgi:hypothetical protein
VTPAERLGAGLIYPGPGKPRMARMSLYAATTREPQPCGGRVVVSSNFVRQRGRSL